MSSRLYTALLRLLPRAFQERFEAEMLDTERQNSERLGRRPWSTASALLDLIVTIVALRAEELRGRLHPLDGNGNLLRSWLEDARFAVRGLRRDPLFTTFAVATLSLGIGAGGTMFGIVDRLLLRGPDHVVDSDRVMRLYVSHEPAGMRRFTSAGVGHVAYDMVRSKVGALSEVATYATNESVLGQGAEARAVRVTFASGTFFQLLGVEPALGRFFGPEEDDPAGAERVVVLAHGSWLREFGGRPDAIGATLLVGDRPHTVVGVAPPGFTGAELVPVEMWLPMNLLSPSVTTDWATTWSAQWLKVIGRLAHGATAEQADIELTSVFRAVYAGDETSMKSATLFMASLSAGDSGAETEVARVARWLLGVAALLLLVVCANLANLLLARGIRRARELSVRLALGASAARVQRLVALESFVLAFAGAAAALAVAHALGGVARRTLLTNVHWSTPPVDARVLAVTTLTALAIGTLMGLAPTLRAVALAGSAELVKGGARDGGRSRGILRSSLSIAQAALSVTLLIGAGLFTRSLLNARATDLGIEADEVLVVEVTRAALAGFSPEQREVERARRRTFPLDALERLTVLPGVSHAAVAVGMPFGNRFSVRLWIPGRDSVPRLSTGIPTISAVSSDYFVTVGTPIVRGRPFQAVEGAGSERVTIVSETMANTVWPGEDPLGKCVVAMSDTLPCARVVGVAADTHRGALREEPSMHYYIPAGQEIGFGGGVLLLRGEGAPHALGPDARRALIEMDPSITYVAMQTVQERIDPQLRPWRLGTSVLSAAGVLGLITLVVGIYSITSYLVSLRTREIGVRVALGATGLDVVRLVVSGVAATALVGAAIGSAAALTAGGFLRPLLFDVSPRDPLVFTAAIATLLAASVLACVAPCVRARHIDPIQALQTE